MGTVGRVGSVAGAQEDGRGGVKEPLGSLSSGSACAWPLGLAGRGLKERSLPP